MIRCIDVHKAYRMGERTVDALRGASLAIERSGFYGVMGASGSGKSTLLHLLAGLDVPDAGEVHVAGSRVDTMSERELTRFRRERMGIVFQQFNLIPTMTARQNIELPGLLAGRNGRDLRGRVDQLLDRLDIADRAEHRPDAMSGGEQQRVAIARALLFEPPVLFADEPTGNLDSRSSEGLWSLLADLAADHEMSVIMVTHEPAAAAHCRSVFLLQDGRVTGIMKTEGLDASSIAAEYQCLSRPA